MRPENCLWGRRPSPPALMNILHLRDKSLFLSKADRVDDDFCLDPEANTGECADPVRQGGQAPAEGEQRKRAGPATPKRPRKIQFTFDAGGGQAIRHRSSRAWRRRACHAEAPPQNPVHFRRRRRTSHTAPIIKSVAEAGLPRRSAPARSSSLSTPAADKPYGTDHQEHGGGGFGDNKYVG